ncbi:MAG: hypothetical protein LBH03_06505 [Holophagales bacterium]|jgi:hypothetical protein|nr:hypothetical protein [Holophagales bacterium]
MLTIIIPAFAVAVMQSQAQQIEASTLPKVNGPMPPDYFDPAPDSYRREPDAYIRRQSRKANKLPAVALPEGDIIVNDEIKDVAGWKAYQVIVPADKTVKMRLKAVHEAWFMVKTVNRWGHVEKGMTQNLLHKFDPEASYINKDRETKTVYFIVDTNELNMSGEKYTLHVTWN